jgi:ElaB/YqjD/DUF883 family membrane-anchored ribosome-binding protein
VACRVQHVATMTTTSKIIDDGKDLLETAGNSTKKFANDAKEKVIDVKDASMERLSENLDQLAKMIKRSPLLAAGIAVGVGLGIGYLTAFLIHRD